MLGAIKRLGREVAAVRRVCGVPAALEYTAAIVRATPQILSTHTLRPADVLVRDQTWIYDVDGTRFALDGRHFSGAREMYCRGVYFAPAAMRLSGAMTVLDFGAHAGLFSLIAALKGARVIAVEGQADLVEEMRSLLANYGVLDRVSAEWALVGVDSSNSSHDDEPKALSMEELFAKYSIDRVGFLKCDIEGSEFSLFREPGSWLDKIDKIAMEVHAQFGDPVQLAKLLERRGFVVEMRDNDLNLRSNLQTDGYVYAWRA